MDGGYARDYAERVINQPAGSAIYFGVDLDPTDEQITGNIRPYFEGVRGALRENGDQRYKIGVYGSGATCAAILDAQLAEFAWLAQSTGWRDYKAFRDSNRWSLRQLASTKVGEIECDGDVAGANGFGDFQLTTESVAPGERLETVIAKSGLRLRSGPGIDFDVLNILPFGSRVHVVKTVGDWALVDLSGSGGADGFVNSHFLG